jgi:lipoprotein-anchoring transpeptidase ErfK/SrfK
MLGYAMIEVSIKTQTLTLFRDKEIISRYPISSAKKGVGQVKNSNCTPLGSHIIRAKIGAGYPMHAIFHSRRWKGELWDPDGKINSEDHILSRILWLSGTEIGFNRLENVDTMQRFIYIHGTHDEENIGRPVSHGCIRMKNKDVINLFDLVNVGEEVIINE